MTTVCGSTGPKRSPKSWNCFGKLLSPERQNFMFQVSSVNGVPGGFLFPRNVDTGHLGDEGLTDPFGR